MPFGPISSAFWFFSAAGGGGAAIVSVALPVKLPPAPVHMRSYINTVGSVGALTVNVPVGLCAPLQLPLAVQPPVALVDDQDSVALALEPAKSVDGLTPIVTVGGGAAATLRPALPNPIVVPSGAVQVNV